MPSYVNRAHLLIRLNWHKKALTDIEEAMILAEGNQPPLYYMKGLCLAGQGNYRDALHCFHDAEILGFKHSSVCTQKGLALEKLNDYSEAKRYLRKALENQLLTKKSNSLKQY